MNITRTILALCSLILLTACQSGGTTVKEKLGFSRGPDESMVISSPALSIPPNFDLRPPVSGQEAGAKSSNNSQDVRGMLFGGSAANPYDMSGGAGIKSSPLPSAGEEMLLEKAGTKDINPDIRSILEKDENDTQPKSKSSSLLDKFNIFSKKPKTLNTADLKDDNGERSTKASDVLRNDALAGDKKRICNVKNGAAQYCEGRTIMKTIPLEIPVKHKTIHKPTN